jgi:predicted nucleic acid-binding protein
MIILDTNVVSEFTKAVVSDRVVAWFGRQSPLNLATTAVTEAEMLTGIALLPDGRRKMDLERETLALLASFGSRVFPFDHGAAQEMPTVVLMRRARRLPTDQADGQIAAIARCRSAMVATRNTAHFEHCGITLINPWTD